MIIKSLTLTNQTVKVKDLTPYILEGGDRNVQHRSNLTHPSIPSRRGRGG